MGTRITAPQHCPLCDLKNGVSVESLPQAGVYKVACPRCGAYRVPTPDANKFHFLSKGDEATEILHPALAGRLHLVSGHIRELDTRGVGPPQITLELAEALVKAGPVRVTERLDRLLLNLSEMAQAPNEALELEPERDYPLAYCRDGFELKYFLEALAGLKYIKRSDVDKRFYRYRISYDGWRRVEELAEGDPISQGQAFVAMDFDDALKPVFKKAIEPAIEAAGYRAFRVDLEEHADLIDDVMVAEIRRSWFLVADLTGHNHGAYFEAGYGKGLGRIVILTCREDDFKKTHFDIEHYNHIIWTSAEDLRRRLEARIRAVIGTGPLNHER